ncbi:hypothetical protein QBC47DRAFT_270330, partial [Echria macrotheca]
LDLGWTQEFSARNRDPLRLMAFLRSEFGLGRYEISMIRGVYHVRTPRQLLPDEVARCMGF